MIKIEDRRNTDSKKWHKYAGTDVIPLWIADSDFKIDENITKAIEERLNNQTLGYPYNEEAFLQSLVDHCQNSYDWTIHSEWIVPIPGCVPGLNFARGVSKQLGKNSGLVVTPNYPPFFSATKMLDFTHQKVPMILKENRWDVDFEKLNATATDDTGLLILCHPHNPVGRNYDKKELEAYLKVAQNHDLIVCSDEIHCDLILNNKKHIPFASINEDSLNRTITLMSASKTYNIAGMCCAFAIIANEKLRNLFTLAGLGMTDVNILGRVASMAAFNHGKNWHQEEIAYLQENAKILEKRVNAMPKLHVTPIEATYLAFIDCRELGLANAQKYFETKGLGFADGADYGKSGFVRLNFACSHELLDKALTRLEIAVNEVVHG